MAAPRWLAGFNRRVTNRVTGLVAPRLPGFGVIVHRGRRSGRPYRTPVNVFRAPGGYVVALTYGAESDWVKNVLAAGGGELEWRGRRVQLTAPRIVHDEGRGEVPLLVRLPLRLMGVADFLWLSAAAPSAPPGSGARPPAGAAQPSSRRSTE
jgi:deazaflavin-dependent oxidoreductase (nitroreductase family)